MEIIITKETTCVLKRVNIITLLYWIIYCKVKGYKYSIITKED